jgi:serine/threonine protein kinase
MKNFGNYKRKNFKDIFRGAPAEAIDLLDKLLVFNPKKRLTVEEALEHPYLAEVHDIDDEPSAENISSFDFEFENYELDRADYK